MNEKGIPSIQIKTLTVKVSSSKIAEVGSGIIFLPKSQENNILVITAKHCICGNNFSFSPNSSDITIEVFSKDKQDYLSYQLSSDDQLLYFEEDSKDIAVIVIGRDDFPISIEEVPLINLVQDSKGIRNSSIFGFPAGSFNKSLERIDTILQLPTDSFEWKAEPQRTLQAEEFDSTRASVKGFSGSGFLLNALDEYFLFGIVTKFLEWNRFFGVKIHLVNDLLQINDYPAEPIYELEVSEEVKRGIDFLNRNSDRILENIKRKSFLGSEKIDLERAEIKKEIIDSLNSQKVVFINGHAGYGKSVLAEKVISSISSIHTIWAIKAEQLTSVDINGFIFNNGSTAKFETILDSPLLFKQKIILVDSTEKLLETQELDGLESLLELVNKRDDLKLLFTIRDYALGTMITLPAGAYESVEISGISKLEMEQVSKAYPALESLNKNKDIAQILKVPFYLNFVLQLLPELVDNENLDERKLKIKLWKKIIEKSNTLRGNIFKRLALKRAREMKYYVPLDDENQVIIGELIKDEIIIRFEDQYGNYSFAPAHDIFEDWALVKYVQSCKDSVKGDLITFYKEIGNAYSIRRGFRFWLQEELKNSDPVILFSDFISESLGQTEIDTYWKDEILVSVLLSPHCTSFLNENEDKFLANDAKLLIKLIHLLRTACRKPFKSALPDDKQDQESKLYSFNFEPIGESWVSIISFIYQNQTILEKNHILILGLLLDWEGKLHQSFFVPDESKMVGELLLKVLRLTDVEYRGGFSGNNNKKYEKGVSLLFRLTEVLKEEISKILEQSLAYYLEKEIRFRERRRHHFGQEHPPANPFVKPDDILVVKFHKFILKNALSCFDARELCYFLPDLVIKLAKETWLIKKTKPEEYHTGIGVEEYFGLANEHKINCFPASAYQTPIFFLLRFHSKKALNFIIEIVNHSTEHYRNSTFGKRNGVKETTLVLNSGEKVTKWSNITLWTVYRSLSIGTSKPSLLESVMMALEKWLLILGKSKKSKDHEMLIYAVKFLLQKSNSVMTTSIVTSVSMAYPFILKNELIPIFSVPDFFNLDRARYLYRENIIAPSIVGKKHHRTERIEAATLDHRNQQLETFLFKISHYQDFQKPIFSILDNHYKEIEKSTDDNHSWELTLNRMDQRRCDYKVNPDDENQIIVTPIIKEDLKDYVEEGEVRQKKEAPILDSTSWTLKIMKKNIPESNTFDNWKKHKMNVSTTAIGTFLFPISAFKSNSSIAFIGLKYHLAKMESDDIMWCIDTIFESGEKLQEDEQNENILGKSTGLLDNEAVIKALPLILKSSIDKKNLSIAKEQIIQILLRILLSDNLERPLFRKLAEQLWEVDYLFAVQCFRTLYDHAKLKRPRRDYQNPQKYKLEKKEFDANKSELVKKGVEGRMEEISNVELTLEQLKTLQFDKVFAFLPEKKPFTDELESFRIAYERILIPSTFKKEEGKYRNTRIDLIHTENFYQEKSAKLLFHQEIKHSQISLLSLLDYVLNPDSKDNLTHETIDLITGVIRRLIFLEDIHRNDERFWFLWRMIYDQSIKTNNEYFSDVLLLKSLTFSLDWKPLHGHSVFVKKIIEKFGVNNIRLVVDLLSGAGATTLLPNGILWLKDIIEKNDNKISDIFSFEKLIQRTYFMHRKSVQEDPVILKAYIYILDLLVEAGSSSSYYLRDIVMSKIG